MTRIDLSVSLHSQNKGQGRRKDFFQGAGGGGGGGVYSFYNFNGILQKGSDFTELFPNIYIGNVPDFVRSLQPSISYAPADRHDIHRRICIRFKQNTVMCIHNMHLHMDYYICDEHSSLGFVGTFDLIYSRSGICILGFKGLSMPSLHCTSLYDTLYGI